MKPNYSIIESTCNQSGQSSKPIHVPPGGVIDGKTYLGCGMLTTFPPIHPSSFLTTLEKRTVYVGKSLCEEIKGNVTNLCGEEGSISNPCQTITRAIEIIENNYTDNVGIFIFPGNYIESEEYNFPANVSIISSHMAPQNTIVSGTFQFQKRIEIQCLTFLDSKITFAPQTEITVKNCEIKMCNTIVLNDIIRASFSETNFENVNVSFENNLDDRLSLIAFDSCRFTPLDFEKPLFELKVRNQSKNEFKVKGCSLVNGNGIARCDSYGNAKIIMEILESTVEEGSSNAFTYDANQNSELRGSIIRTIASLDGTAINGVAKQQSNFSMNLVENTFSSRARMVKYDMQTTGNFQTIMEDNKFYENAIRPTRTPFISFSCTDATCSIVEKDNIFIARTETLVPIIQKDFVNCSVEAKCKGNTYENKGEGDGLIGNLTNTRYEALTFANELKVPLGRARKMFLSENSVFEHEYEAIKIQANRCISIQTDESSKVSQIASNLKQVSPTSNDNIGESQIILEGNVESRFTTMLLEAMNTTEPLLKINGGSHAFSNVACTQGGDGDLFAIKDAKVECFSSNLRCGKGRGCSAEGNSLFNVNTSQMVRNHGDSEDMIQLKDKSSIEISASSIQNSNGSCLHLVGEETKSILNATKVSTNERSTSIRGNGKLAQSSSMCLVGNKNATMEPNNLPDGFEQL